MNEHLTDPRVVFVFGSNTAGRHGKGAAKVAKDRYGAQYGRAEGHMGRSYGIPTKGERDDSTLYPLSLPEIRRHIESFLIYARRHSELTFIVTAVGCGLAGYEPRQIGPMFREAPENVFVSPRLIG